MALSVPQNALAKERSFVLPDGLRLTLAEASAILREEINPWHRFRPDQFLLDRSALNLDEAIAPESERMNDTGAKGLFFASPAIGQEDHRIVLFLRQF